MQPLRTNAGELSRERCMSDRKRMCSKARSFYDETTSATAEWSLCQ